MQNSVATTIGPKTNNDNQYLPQKVKKKNSIVV